MAPRRQAAPAVAPPPSADKLESTEEEEEEEEDGEERDESGFDNAVETRPKKQNPTQPTPPPPAAQTQKRTSSSEPESGSHSEDESRSDSPTYIVYPIPSKPVETSRSGPSASSPTKRKVETADATKLKKTKSEAGERSVERAVGEAKKPAFLRVWSDEDEIALLQGMIDFRDQNDMDPSANTNAFHQYIKKFLGLDVSASQLTSKMKRMKKKYKNSEGRMKKKYKNGEGKGKNCEDKVLLKPHEERCLDLSKRIWGNVKKIGAAARQDIRETADSKPDSSTMAVPEWAAELMFIHFLKDALQIAGASLNEKILLREYELLGESKKDEFFERWKKLRLVELQFLTERSALSREVAFCVMDARNSNKI